MRIDVDAVCRHVLSQNPGEAEIEARVRAVCRNVYGEQGETAARAVLRAIEQHADDGGMSRMGALADLAGAQAEVNVTRQVWSSLDEVPPELRERFEQLMRDGKQENVTQHRVIRWDSSDGPPSEEVAEAIGKALGEEGLRRGQRIVVRRSFGVRGFIVFLVALAAVVAVQLVGVVLESRKPSGRLGSLMEQISRLETQRAEEPEDLAVALDLATAYARKLLYVQSLGGLRDTMPASPAQDGDLSEEGQKASDALRRAVALAGGAEEGGRLAVEGEALARELVSRQDLSQDERVQAHVLLGHFLLAQGRTQQARQASESAAELASGDIGVALLNVMIYQRAGDYDGAIRENQRAASGLAAWARDGVAMRRYVAWGMGPEPVADEMTWRKHVQDIADQARARIELHTSVLRALGQSQELLRRSAEREAMP